MDKTLKRRIGYVPGFTTEKIDALKKKEKINTLVETKTGTPVLDDGVKMAIWLKSFSILNKSALCKKANIDRGNFDKYLVSGKIPSQHIESIKKIIKDYGYE